MKFTYAVGCRQIAQIDAIHLSYKTLKPRVSYIFAYIHRRLLSCCQRTARRCAGG